MIIFPNNEPTVEQVIWFPTTVKTEDIPTHWVFRMAKKLDIQVRVELANPRRIRLVSNDFLPGLFEMALRDCDFYFEKGRA